MEQEYNQNKSNISKTHSDSRLEKALEITMNVGTGNKDIHPLYDQLSEQSSIVDSNQTIKENYVLGIPLHNTHLDGSIEILYKTKHNCDTEPLKEQKGGQSRSYIASQKYIDDEGNDNYQNIFVKLILPHSDEEGTRECEIHSDLSSKTNAVPKFRHRDRIKIDNGRHMYALCMENVEGKELSDYIHDDNTSERDKLYLIAKTARAVGEIHNAGYVHWDLKNSNVRVTEDMDVKVIDFGLSKKIGDDGNTGYISGTPENLTPEHFTEKSDPRMDINALGGMLMELLVGKTHIHATASEIRYSTPERISSVVLPKIYDAIKNETYLKKDDNGNVVRLQNENPKTDLTLKNMSQDITDLISRCVRADPNLRYQTCDEVAEEAERIVNKMDMHAVLSELATMDLAEMKYDDTVSIEEINGFNDLVLSCTEEGEPQREMDFQVYVNSQFSEMREAC
ncbi:protein kinase [Candidatus Woesearchaeota archaeon]|nr:protein kinase [Candidatus Woesearchaeota archaeon]